MTNRPHINWGGLPPYVTHLLAVLLTAVLAVGITVSVESPTPSNPHKTVRVTLGGPKRTTLGPTKVQTVSLDPKAQAILRAQRAENAAGDPVGAESQLHEKAPPSAAAERAAKAIQPPGQPAVPAHVPLASAYQPGCATSFVRNFSTRRGAPIDLGVIHWTGSSPTPGPQGGLAIVRWFDTSASQASSNYITDQSARCWYVVPETQKAWTQAAANPWSVSVEIINAGVQPLFQNTTARNAVVKLMIGWHHRWKLPYRHARVNSNCVPVVTGFLSHRDLGRCGGGHPDVGTFNLDGLISEAAAKDRPSKPVTTTERTWCRKLTWWRTHGRPHGQAETNAVRRAHLLKRHKVTCTRGHATK